MRYTGKEVEWLLRIGVAGEFIGHGLLAIEGKKDWIAWIRQMTNASNETATTLLLLIGISDVIVAMVTLARPVRPILVWAAAWGFWTALVRPLVGLSVLDFIERAANWAAPLALYYCCQRKAVQQKKVVEDGVRIDALESASVVAAGD